MKIDQRSDGELGVLSAALWTVLWPWAWCHHLSPAVLRLTSSQAAISVFLPIKRAVCGQEVHWSVIFTRLVFIDLCCFNIYSTEEFSVFKMFLKHFTSPESILPAVSSSRILTLSFFKVFSGGMFKSSAFQRFCYCPGDLSHVQAPVKHPVLSPALLPTRQALRCSMHRRWRETASISDDFARILTCQLHFLWILFPYLHPHTAASTPTFHNVFHSEAETLTREFFALVADVIVHLVCVCVWMIRTGDCTKRYV